MIIKINPDILAGYDIETLSLYYISYRAHTKYNLDFMNLIGRSPKNLENIYEILKLSDYKTMSNSYSNSILSNQNSNLNYNKNAGISLIQENSQSILEKIKKINSNQNQNQDFRFQDRTSGRIIFNIYRMARGQHYFNYDFYNVVNKLLQKQEANYSDWTLTQWFNNSNQKKIVLNHMFKQIQYTEKIIEETQVLKFYIEQCKLFGCDMSTLILRAGMYRIETIFQRVGKNIGHIMLTGNRQQISSQKMLSGQPLVLEPAKLLYVDPVMVLDFQSLYPSIMIAYNICYSTCLGHIEEDFKEGGLKRVGVKLDQDVQLSNIFEGKTDQEILDSIFIAPNKAIFVRKHIKEGIIPQMLEEFLNTRILLKNSKNLYSEEYQKLKKEYDIKQHALKMFMNTLFGYTGAIYSDNAFMSMGELSDAITEIASSTLKQVIDYINSHKEWGAQVVYGDTDSVFVMVKGKSKDQVFDQGQEMVKEITSLFPYPMDLKFEKIYQPLIMVSKKRYVGHKYEKKSQEKPKLDGKGIEIVRRDGCMGTVKIMKKSIDLLFSTRNLTLTKDYLRKQWNKILSNQFNSKNYIIQKGVKLGSYSLRLPAHAQVAQNLINQDERERPKYGERVKYVILQGNDKDKITDMALSVKEYVNSGQKGRINVQYYIKNQINACLHRIFTSCDVTIDDWYLNQKKTGQYNCKIKLQGDQKLNIQQQMAQQSFTLNKYFKNQICILCYKKSSEEICNHCSKDLHSVLCIIQQKLYNLEKISHENEQKCKNCSNLQYQNIEEVPCIEYNCNFFYKKWEFKTYYQYLKPILLKYNQFFQNQINELENILNDQKNQNSIQQQQHNLQLQEQYN